jgi:hypothetical protein
MRRALAPEDPANHFSCIAAMLGSAPLRFSLPLALCFFVSIPSTAQAPTQPQTTAPTAPQAQAQMPAQITMEQEGHHHLVFENSYVKVYYVEIPPHDATLYHRHDLPYVSLPPPPALAESARERPGADGSRVGYRTGGFSHTVTNSRVVPLRNVAIELLRPQGAVRNRCAQVIRDQPLGDCDKPSSNEAPPPVHYRLFETDEIAVEYWNIGPRAIIQPSDARLSTLVGGLSGIADVIANGNSHMVPQAGMIWLLPGSKAEFQAGPDFGGYFVTLTFKDSAVKP